MHASEHALMKLLKWLSVVVGSLAALVLVGGPTYQAISESRDLARFPAPGRLVEVDGSLMHIDCRGLGSPTVVVELGLSAVASSWDEIHQQMAPVTRVCLYDRAGLGYSEPIDHSTRAPEVAERLHSLLGNAEIGGDLILVGWSAGGLYAREFYRLYPERVRAMLLVDSSHEQQARRLPASARDGSDSALRMARYLAPLGLVRLSGMVKARFGSFRGPDELRARLIALYEQSHVVGTMLGESDAFDYDIDGDPPTSLGDLPLIVLSPGAPIDASEPMSSEELEYLERSQEVRDDLQIELASLSARGKQIIAAESGHAIQFDQPELLIESIAELVQVVRGEYD